jgi:exo-beta-1,3-glucanase (GH17 family)
LKPLLTLYPVKSCKEKLVAAGFSSNIPVTTAETVDAWEKNGAALCDSVDVIAAQIHPYFDGGVVAGKSGEFAVTQLAQAAKSCPKAAANGQYITECGWPKEGKTNGVAVPGVQQQKEAIASIIKSVGSITTLFSYQDDAWKEPGPFGVERKFGCADVL